MNQYNDLPLLEAHRAAATLRGHLFDVLHLQKMIAAAQSAELWCSAFILCPIRHFVRYKYRN